VVLTLSPATPEHAEQLELRAADLAECVAAGYRTGREALLESLRESTAAWAIFFDGRLAGLMGLDPRGWPKGTALVWLLTGRVVDEAWRSFARASRFIVAEMLELHRRLVCLVDPRYTRALRWLEWLGFVVGEEFPHPASGLPVRLGVLGGA
jgi:hypothetical protein